MKQAAHDVLVRNSHHSMLLKVILLSYKMLSIHHQPTLNDRVLQDEQVKYLPAVFQLRSPWFCGVSCFHYFLTKLIYTLICHVHANMSNGLYLYIMTIYTSALIVVTLSEEQNSKQSNLELLQ